MTSVGIDDALAGMIREMARHALEEAVASSRVARMTYQYGEAIPTSQAAKLLHVSRETIAQMGADGRLRRYEDGHVDVASIAAYLDRKTEADRIARFYRNHMKGGVRA